MLIPLLVFSVIGLPRLFSRLTLFLHVILGGRGGVLGSELGRLILAASLFFLLLVVS